MKLVQIAFSPDGNDLYALDDSGKLWVASVKDPASKLRALRPDWNPVKLPPQ